MKIIQKVYLWYLDFRRKQVSSPRIANLHALIEKAKRRMKLTPKCPYCLNVMSFRDSRIWKGFPYRDDQSYKCTFCFHTCTFGLPITKKEYEMELKLRGSPYLLRPDFNPSERNNKETIERLRALGYLEI